MKRETVSFSHRVKSADARQLSQCTVPVTDTQTHAVITPITRPF